MVRITYNELLFNAKGEEKKFNLKEALNIYEKLLKMPLIKNNEAKAANIYKKMGEIYTLAVSTSETEDEYSDLINKAIEAYNHAIELYEDLNFKVKILECEAGIFRVEMDKGISPEYCKESGINSFEKYIEASRIYEGKHERKKQLKILHKAVESLGVLLQYYNDPNELKQICQKGSEIIENGWKLSNEIGNKKYLGNFLFVLTFIFGSYTWTSFTRINAGYELYQKLNQKCNEALDVVEEIDELTKAKKFFSAAGINCVLATRYIYQEKEQIRLVNKGIEYYEKSLALLRKINYAPVLINNIYWLDYHIVLLGKFQYLQRRILSDVKEIQKSGKTYQNLYSFWGFLTNFLSAYYYRDFALRSFLNPASRVSYAKKGIKELEDGLKKLPFGPFFGLSYQLATNLYSELVLLTTDKEKREKYIKKMFYYASAAEEEGKKYKGGMVRAAGYDSVYRAHRTLFNIITNNEEKINHLSAAIKATEKNIDFSIESHRNYIATHMHLGLLYEDLAILTKKKEPLFQAREIFLQLIKDTEEKGYFYHTAAGHEYLARIEDRMGNHSVSAQQYELAKNAHIKSLEKIDFKLLKDRVKEKIEYDNAWNLIENAKAAHKKEYHIEAKRFYERACEILKILPKYKYEALYYLSWALLESSEHESKKENHKEAIQKYQSTIGSFEETIETLEGALTKSSSKIENERIEKLEKVANVRINYCSARINLERARILQKQNEHLSAAENFALSATKFRDICTLFKIEREKKELEAIYYLCRAWEGMELAENYQEPERFLEASQLFLKTSNLFTDSKLKLLASGNSFVCLALESGCRFDESANMENKMESYKKVKIMLRNASRSYEKGGFINGADWALGTSTYFDALWYLIKMDEELDLEKKKQQLEIGVKYLKSAADMFEKSGYRERKEEIYEKLIRIEKEEKILYSALNAISNPVISRSTVGIVAPACPIETSLSPKLSEINQLTVEARDLSEITEKDRKYTLIYNDLLKKYPKIQRRECRIGVAQIGLSKSGDIMKEYFDIKESGLLGIKEDVLNSLKLTYKQMIEKANSNGINILIFPEMMIDLNYDQLLEELINYSKIYDMYVIPGSYHNERTKRNVSLVISPEGILWEQEKHIPATIHISSNKFVEAIEVSNYPRNTIITNTEFGRIAITICRDFLDMDLRVELKNFEPPVDIIINPAFTPVTADFKAAHFDARRSIYAYCFFANVAEFGDSLIYTPEKDRTERIIPAKEEGLIYKDVDLFKLRSERKKWEKERNKGLKFIQSTR
ncbi:MAG: nitrilase-related carbon-nitrogen hydrolase [Promethearchaeota archaeon]